MAFTTEQREGLLHNSLDSMRHALDHFFELGTLDRTRKESGYNLQHHHKWVILSVHHAADCLLQVFLDDLDPASQCLQKRGKLRHPSLSRTLRALRRPANTDRLKESEKLFLKLVEDLNKQRNDLMHGTLPETIQPSVAAFLLLALRRVLRTRYAIAEEDFAWWEDDLGQHVMREIHLKHYDLYFQYVERAVAEDNPDRWVDSCPYCGTLAIPGTASRCEACFLVIDWIECSSCGTEFAHMAHPEGDEPRVCPSCDSVQPEPPAGSCP